MLTWSLWPSLLFTWGPCEPAQVALFQNVLLPGRKLFVSPGCMLNAGLVQLQIVKSQTRACASLPHLWQMRVSQKLGCCYGTVFKLPYYVYIVNNMASGQNGNLHKVPHTAAQNKKGMNSLRPQSAMVLHPQALRGPLGYELFLCNLFPLIPNTPKPLRMNTP